MKKVLSLSLSLIMVFTALLGFNVTVFAEGADAVTSASTSTGTTSSSTYTANAVIPTGSGVYVVKSGDVMWKIAKAHGLTLDQLLKMNPWIKNANSILVGQQIVVKMNGMTTAVSPAAAMTNELYMGMGNKSNFRVRGTNYSMNMTTASVLFDKEGKIVSAFVDTYEVGQATGFTNWPGATDADTIETAAAQVADWKSKRELGDAYGMAKSATTGNEWYVQMDNYQKFFVGKTVAELRMWFDKSTGATGKPIVATTEKEDELAKLALLTDAEKANLADVVSSATMSLSDSHALILEAIEEAYAKKVLVK